MGRLRNLRRTGIGLLALLLLGSRGASSQPTPVGPEIDVFGASADYAYYPRIATDPAGNFVVAWVDSYTYATTRARGFWSNGNPRGPIFEANPPGIETDRTSFDVDELAAVAADDAGNFVIAFNGYGEALPACDARQCILTKRYDADGKVSSSTFVVGDPRQNTYATDVYNQCGNPELAADGEGNFVVAWEGYDENEDGTNGAEGVWARRLVASGQINGGAFRTNEHTQNYQGDGGFLDVAADREGNFVVVWEDNNYVLPPYGGIVFRRFDQAKNPVGAQTQVQSSGRDPHVAQHPDGAFLVAWQDANAIAARMYDETGTALGPAFQVASDGDYPEVAASASGQFIVVYVSDDDASGRIFDATGAPLGSEFTIPDGWKPSVGADAAGNFVVAYTRDGYAYAQRFEMTSPTPEAIPVTGKVAVLTNKIPDDPEKSGGKWTASGSAIVSPLRGSSSDPRCNGEPEGTVKASVRFRSATSGQDHTFPLPCEKWSATGGNKVAAVAKRGYKYSDPKREHGPCNSVKIKGTKSLSVSCKGKPGTAAFPFDLVSGQSQGTLTTVLETGWITHCATFEPFVDGSDAKKYKGKSLGPPVACP